MSSLDVALKRLLRYELIKPAGKVGITLLLDLKQFYQHADHETLVGQAEKQGFPPAILHIAVQIYKGPGFILAEGGNHFTKSGG